MSLRRIVQATLDLPLARLEPLASAALTLHGGLVLAVLGSQPWQWLVLAGYGALAAWGVASRGRSAGRTPSLMLVLRAGGTLLVAWVMQAFGGSDGSFFLLWMFVGVAIFPLRLSPYGGLAYGAAASLAYLALLAFDATDGPPAVAVLRAVCLALVALLVTGSARALRRTTEQRDELILELTAFFDAVPLGLAIFDPHLRFIRVNNAMAEINGLPVAAQLGRPLPDVLPDLPAAVPEALRRVFSTGEPTLSLHVEGETPAQPGQRRIWEASYSPSVATARSLLGRRGGRGRHRAAPLRARADAGERDNAGHDGRCRAPFATAPVARSTCGSST